MSPMTWEEKIQAMQAIRETRLSMRKPGDWYVELRGVERVEGSLLCSGCDSEATPQLAVCSRWAWLTDKKYPVLRINGGMLVTWNGFMWKVAA